jgi:hypothetical protein
LLSFELDAELNPPDYQDSQSERLELLIRNWCWCTAIEIKTLNLVLKVIRTSLLSCQLTDDTLDLPSIFNANFCKIFGRWRADRRSLNLPFPHPLQFVPRLALFPNVQSMKISGVKKMFSVNAYQLLLWKIEAISKSVIKLMLYREVFKE